MSQLSHLVSPKLFLYVMTLNRAMLVFELILDYVISHAETIQNNKKISHPTKIHQLSLKLLASRTSRFHIQPINIQSFAKDWRIFIVVKTWKMRQSLACQSLACHFLTAFSGIFLVQKLTFINFGGILKMIFYEIR